ncbi:hypothetical protein AMEX_G13177 [Astyanax mexicanus]|uniref:Uncharacterized protein n=1 Tax=Astyanax mexicanus TaxID=7994 RepID=A0A8T2LMV9_ASTMX|nr:hypothetical protein AMEX_G13177 [Astyanax mexicanus]
MTGFHSTSDLIKLSFFLIHFTVNVDQERLLQILLVSVWLWWVQGRTTPPAITCAQVKEEIELLLQKTETEIDAMKNEMYETVIDNKRGKVQQAFSVLHQITCYKHSDTTLTSVLNEVKGVQTALMIQGHKHSDSGCPSLEDLSLWDSKKKKYSLLRDLKAVLIPLQPDC